MKQSLREIIHAAVRGRVMLPRLRRQPKKAEVRIARSVSAALRRIRAWAGGLTLGEEALARHPERSGEGAVYIRSERKKRMRGKHD